MAPADMPSVMPPMPKYRTIKMTLKSSVEIPNFSCSFYTSPGFIVILRPSLISDSRSLSAYWLSNIASPKLSFIVNRRWDVVRLFWPAGFLVVRAT